MVPLSHGTCHKCDMLSGKQRETYGKPRCQKTPLSLLQAPSKPLSLIIPVLGTARRGTKSRKVTKKVYISPRLCWLLFAKPDIPLPRSRTRITRSPKGEKLRESTVAWWKAASAFSPRSSVAAAQVLHSSAVGMVATNRNGQRATTSPLSRAPARELRGPRSSTDVDERMS